jgi:hypothetical protein
MSSTNYYEKRDAKVRIAEELSNMGWKIYGFREDESDSMTDYYSPASWGGLASKNGYVLVVDCRYEGKETEITKRNPNYIQMSNSDQTKIESLKNMTTSNGATTGEAENAQKLIEKLQAKYQGQECDMWEVIGVQPAHLGNSKGCIWHLEKDGALVDKGNKLTIFADVPDAYMFDISTMEYKDSYKMCNCYEWNEEANRNIEVRKERTLTESELKAVNEFKSFILRIERIVNFGNSCGDGTKETEEAFKQQNKEEKMIKKTFTTTKKVIKPVQVERTLKIGDYVNYKGDRATRCYWKVTYIDEKIFHYQSTGKKYQEVKNCKMYYNNLSKLNELYDIFELQEVEEVETVEKWVKAITKITKKETVKTESATESKEEVKEENKTNVQFEIVEDTNTKTQEKIYVAKLVERVEKDQFMIILSKIKKLGGYYYKYKGGFIFAEDPTTLLKNNFSQSESVEQQEKNISKIDKQLESNNKKIEKLSGDYQTNTWKRMREQESRDKQREAFERDNIFLQCIKNKIERNNASGFEKALIIRTLREDFYNYYRRYNYNIKDNKEDITIYPKINPSWEIDSTWNQDTQKQIKRLKEINLNDDRQLKNCLKNDYKEIINSLKNKNQESEVEQKIKKLEREYKMEQRGDINFTPKELVNILIDYSNIKEGDHILEPTAGIGNIADQLKEYTNNIDCIEYMHSYNELLKLKGYNVIGYDFMECDKYNTYDKIVGNVPFSKEIEMVKHAYKMLKSNGKLIIITSPHWTFANDKESINFREWLNNLDYEVYESDISFEFTNVNYKILIINKDENINNMAM